MVHSIGPASRSGRFSSCTTAKRLLSGPAQRSNSLIRPPLDQRWVCLEGGDNHPRSGVQQGVGLVRAGRDSDRHRPHRDSGIPVSYTHLTLPTILRV